MNFGVVIFKLMRYIEQRKETEPIDLYWEPCLTFNFKVRVFKLIQNNVDYYFR